MFARHLIELLERHRPQSGKEMEHRERMLSLARSLAEPFSRHQPQAHFTGSALVVDPPGERVCLVHHAKLHRWLQPGGHADPSDEGRMEATALREAKEETGCRVSLHPAAPRPMDLDIHLIPARGLEPAHLHLDVRFLVVAEDPESLRHDPNESLGARWLSWEEALEMSDEDSLERLLNKARQLDPKHRLAGP